MNSQMTSLVTALGASLVLAGCGFLGAEGVAPSVEVRQDARQDDRPDDRAPATETPAGTGLETPQAEHEEVTEAPVDYGFTEPTDPVEDASPWAGTSAPTAAFLMPSTNVACAMADDWAACEIRTRDYVPNTGDVAYECPPLQANTILLTATEPGQWICSDRSLFGLSAESETVAEYGETWRVGQFTCDSDSDGVACSSPNGSSFRLAREDYDLR